MRLSHRWGALALAASLMLACDATGPTPSAFIGEYDLVLVGETEPPILVRSDTVPAIYMKGIHLEILDSGWNWIVTYQLGLDPAGPTYTTWTWGTWRTGFAGLLLKEHRYSGEMSARFSADGSHLLLEACTGLIGSCMDWTFIHAP